MPSTKAWEAAAALLAGSLDPEKSNLEARTGFDAGKAGLFEHLEHNLIPIGALDHVAGHL